MPKLTDIQVTGVQLYFLPVQTRMPLKFGTETLSSVTCARVRVEVRTRNGEQAAGWGETPLSVQWVWPSALPLRRREDALRSFCVDLARAWSGFDTAGHALEVGLAFQTEVLPGLLREHNARRPPDQEPMPWLAALVCCSAFDIALHDAFGRGCGRPVYQTYSAAFLNLDLAHYLEPAATGVSFAGRFPESFLSAPPAVQLPAWHLVGGLDPLAEADLTGQEPQDGYPVLLRDWIRRDGLQCLKIKLRGTDAVWDWERLVRVGHLAKSEGVAWLTADFNCTVQDPAYVIALLDRLARDEPDIDRMLLYVEQPFPYELEPARIDVHALATRKLLFLDESAHDWRQVRLGRELGWTGVALKTCKTQSGALLSACWAQAHGMRLMVQDLTNPMLAQIPHLLLAAHVPTIMGVETNGMQFYPEASRPEREVHPGVYLRRKGQVDLRTVSGPGFGYRLEEMQRTLPAAAYG